MAHPLENLVDPVLGRRCVAEGWVSKRADGYLITLPYPAKSIHQSLLADAKALGVQNVEIKSDRVSWGLSALPALPGVKNVIAVTSAKGGVGKSTVAVGLAKALAREGARVGVLDADVYGPSCALLLGLGDARAEARGDNLVPVEKDGVQLMSIALLLPSAQTPVIWRGPMATSALQQMLTQTLWNDLDYLIVDTPPGTGDIHLSFIQKAPVSAAIVVTTAEALSILDAEKGIEMLKKLKVPVAGVVENMSHLRCTHCGEKSAVFQAGAQADVGAFIERQNVSLLADLPLQPGVIDDAPLFLSMAHAVFRRVDALAVHAAPSIEIEQ